MFNSRSLRNAIVVVLLILFVIAAAVIAQSSAKPAYPEARPAGRLNSDELLQMVPAESLFCVRLNNIDYTLGQMDQFLLGASPMPMWLSMMVRGHLAKLLGSPELNGLNMNGSFAVFGAVAAGKPPGPKPSDIFIGVLTPVTDYKQFIDGSPNLSPPDANGVSENTNKEFGGMLIKQMGNYALIGPSESGAFAAIAKSISATEAKGLAGTLDADELNKATKEPIWAYGNVQLASRTFGPMLLGKIEEAKKMMESMKVKGKGPMGSPAVIMNIYAGILETLMKETKSLNLAIKPKPTVCELSVGVSAMPGTEMASMFVADYSAEQENKLLGYLKDGAVMNYGVKMNTPFFRQFNVKRMDLIATMAGESVTAEDIAEMKKLATDALDYLGGSAAFSLSVDAANKPPFALRFVAEIKDADKFNRVVEEAAKMMNTGSIADFYKSLGMEMRFELKRGVGTYKGISIDSAKLVMKSTDPNLPQGQMINAMFGDGFNYRWAVADGLWICTVSNDPNSAIRQLIDEVKADSPKQLASEMKSALTLIPQASKADFVGTYNLLRWFGIIGAIMPVPIPFTQMDISTKSNIAFAGKADQGKMTIEVALPKEHLMEVMGIFQRMQQQSDQARQTFSAANLRGIGKACLIYANDYNDKFPPNLQELVEKVELSPKTLESPRKPKGFAGPSYIYISGQTVRMDPGNILAYENPAFCSDKINALFLDSHVEAMKPDAFLQKLEETYKRLGRQMPDIKFKDSTRPMK